jgi:TusA-related sulfurtransferase
MIPNAELNLTGVLPPICLLACKKQLDEMATGDVVCVCLQDQEILSDLTLIIERSRDRIVEQHQQGGLYRVYIQKG